MTISSEAKKKLFDTIVAYLENDGESKEEAEDAADDCISDLLEGIFSFTLWDALGCDDLGLVLATPELKDLQKKITKLWGQSIKEAQ